MSSGKQPAQIASLHNNSLELLYNRESIGRSLDLHSFQGDSATEVPKDLAGYIKMLSQT